MCVQFFFIFEKIYVFSLLLLLLFIFIFSFITISNYCKNNIYVHTYKNFIISIRIKAFAAILTSKPIPMACESI